MQHQDKLVILKLLKRLVYQSSIDSMADVISDCFPDETSVSQYVFLKRWKYQTLKKLTIHLVIQKDRDGLTIRIMFLHIILMILHINLRYYF